MARWISKTSRRSGILHMLAVAAACLLAAGGAGAQEIPGLDRVYRSLRTEWSIIQSLMENRNYPDAFKEIGGFRRSLDSAGIGSATAEAMGLLARVRQLDPEAGRKHALAIIDQAEVLAPDLPAVQAARIDAILRFDLGRWSKIPIAAVDYLRTSFRHYGTRAQVVGLLSEAVAIGILLSTFVLFWIALLRHLPLVHHRLSHAAIYSLPFAFLLLLLAGIVLVSTFLGIGALIPTIFFVTLFGAFYDKRTRRALMVALALLTTLPLLGTMIWNDVTYRLSPIASVVRCEQGICDPYLSEISDPGYRHEAFAADLLYARGVHMARKGYLREARGLLEQARSLGFRGAALDIAAGNTHMMALAEYCPLSEVTDTTRPVVLQAIERYETALKKAPDDAAALYNLSVAYAATGKSERAEKLFARFLARGDGIVPPGHRRADHLRPFSGCDPDLPVAGAVAWGRIDDGRIAALTSETRSRLFPATWLPLHEVFLGRLGPLMLTLVGFSLILILFALGHVGGVTRRCSRCHTAFCRACGETGTSTALCPECLMEQLQISHRDPKDIFLRQNQIERSGARRSRRVMLLGLLIPGLGHLVGRRPLRGLVWLMLVLATTSLLLGPMGYLPAWSSYAGAGDPVSYMAPALILPFIYLFGLFDAFRAGREARR